MQNAKCKMLNDKYQSTFMPSPVGEGGPRSGGWGVRRESDSLLYSQSSYKTASAVDEVYEGTKRSRSLCVDEAHKESPTRSVWGASMHSEEYCSIASYTSSVRLRLPPSPTGEGFVFRRPLRLPATVAWSPCVGRRLPSGAPCFGRFRFGEKATPWPFRLATQQGEPEKSTCQWSEPQIVHRKEKGANTSYGIMVP